MSFSNSSRRSLEQKQIAIIQRFIGVLRINLCVIDSEGHLLFMPEHDDFGLKFLTKSKEGIFSPGVRIDQWLKKLETDGSFKRYRNSYDIYTYVINLSNVPRGIYLVVGPIVLNKKLEKIEYQRRAQRNHHNVPEILDTVNEVRIISNNQIHEALRLLSDIFKEEKQASILSENVSQNLQNILRPLLDFSLAITQAEAGSVLAFDQKSNELALTHSQGINYMNINQVRLRLGESIAGLVGKEKTSKLITQQDPNPQIKLLLKRPEIQQALVVPITSEKGDLIGVLNVHTKKENSYLADHGRQLLGNIEELCRLVGQSLAV